MGVETVIQVFAHQQEEILRIRTSHNSHTYISGQLQSLWQRIETSYVFYSIDLGYVALLRAYTY